MLEKLITLLNGNVVLALKKGEEIATGLKNLTSSFSALSKEVKDQKAPVVNVNVPDVNVPEIKIPDMSEDITDAIKEGFDNLEISIPEVKMPDMAGEIRKGFEGVTVNVPEIKLPAINVPEIKVPQINVPEQKVIFPSEMKLTGLETILEALQKGLSGLSGSLFKGVSHKNPIPVIIIDKDGKPIDWKKMFASAQPQYVGGGIHGLSGVSGAVTPIDGYKCADTDDSTNPAYYGYTNVDGAWYILRETTTGTYRYTRGDTGYATNWTNRGSLTYDYFNNVF